VTGAEKPWRSPWEAARTFLYPRADGGRDADRLRRARVTTLTALAAHGTTIATGFVSVPLTVGYLGPELYGVWLTIGSLLMWLAVTDLGFGGNALINALADAHGRDDRELAREVVATAFWLLTAMAAILAAAFLLAVPHIDWHRVFNVSSAVPASDLRSAATLALFAFLLTFPLGVVTGIYHGYQEGYLSNAWTTAAGLASLGALVTVTHFRGGLPLLVAALWGVRVLVTLASAVHVFGRHRPWLLPVPARATRRGAGRLAALGGKYFAAQLAGIAMFQSQPMIVAQTLGPAQVGVFGVAYRLLSAPLLVVQVVSQPLMPAYGEARARGDWPWIRHTLMRSLWLALGVTVVLTVPLALVAKPLIILWAGPALAPPPGLVWGLALYVIVAGCVTPASVMLYGLERVGGQALVGTLNAVATVVLGIWFTRIWGLSGMGAAMAVALIAANPLAQVFLIRQALKQGHRTS
jgi:O-antigen/teichoic acid export membrane protein